MSLKRCPQCDARFRGELAFCPIDGAGLTTPEDPFVGLTIAGRYLVEEKLGSGGMGTVYRARHQIIGRDVALKFLEPSLCRDERQRRRFLGEARAANQIDHDHIIDISDYGETEDGLVYMVMEYLQGSTLAQDIAKGPLSVVRTLRIARQVALGLARAHELGVVHRDVKPANIYLLDRRGGDFVKLLDFGVARIEQDKRITAQGTIVGTPEYIAPEQIRSAAATPATDLYALGCVMFEMLTGQLPFEGNTTVLLVKHLNDPPPAPSALRPDIPKAVDSLVMKLMAKTPEGRYRDGYHLADELQQALERGAGRYAGELPEAEADGGATDGDPAREPRSATAAVQEEQDWARTLRAFQGLAQEAHPDGRAPAVLVHALASMSAAIVDVKHLRSQLERAAKRATALEEDIRVPRGQIGRALDELAKDESRISRRINQLEAQIGHAEMQLDDLLQALAHDARRVRSPMRPGAILSDSDALHINRFVQAAGSVQELRSRLHEARGQLEAEHLTRKDLSFQIAQLKDKLSSMQRNSTVDHETTHEEVRGLDAQVQAKLATIAPLARQIAEYFQRFPELRDRLGGPENDVPGSNAASA